MKIKAFIYKIKSLYHLFKTGIGEGFLSQLIYGFPEKKLKILALTGTDGKTTTSTLVYHLLKKNGYNVALISTVAAFIGEEKIETGFHVTSPAPKALYRLLRQMVKQKVEYLVLEITSQGAYQYRNWGLKPLITGLTNIDFEHLDYHLNQENYLQAKMKVLNSAKTAVVNEEMEIFPRLKKSLKENIKLITFSRKTRFSALLEKAIREKFAEDYNRLNAYLAITMLKQLSLNDKDLAQALESFQLPEGRMEFVPTGLPFSVIVDFAHTPQALQAALSNIRRNYLPKGAKLISLAGCAGLRDHLKRPAMGQILAKFSDRAIFTAEDPRTENIWAIINQMKENLGHHHHKVISIPHREAALRFALEHYGKDQNLIAIFGKGHEQSMCYDGKTETPWNDIVAAKAMIKELKKNADKK